MEDEELTAEDLQILDADMEIALYDEDSPGRTESSVTPPSTTVDNVSILDADLVEYFNDDDEEAQMEHLECLKTKFKHNAFKEKQWAIIKALRENRDVCAVMANVNK